MGFEIIYIQVCSVAQPWMTLSNPMDCSQPGSSVHGIFQARMLKWVAISFSRVYSWTRDWTHISCVSCIVGEFLATAEAHIPM